MNKIEDVLQNTDHRPWPLPEDKWVYYQEWNRLLFLHFEVPFEDLRELVPDCLTLDDFNGKYYISIVPFTMENIRPRQLPSVGFISDFDELNVRTYVKHGDKAGVYFLNIEAGKRLSAFVSRLLSGLPYEKAKMKRSKGQYLSLNEEKKFFLKAKFIVGKPVVEKTALQLWLTERYCLYIYENEELFRYEIHHKEWDIKEITFEDLVFNYRFGNIHLTEENYICPNYSDGIVVVSWGKEKVEI
ncbi:MULTISPECIES: YqjF family protein [Myroides]|uniref:DUF2071 domain-containing protein n=1 Tax=Myroides albus TaxID=2562892 RepID=A0A6I3LIF8_9FLAO|nr:MULTISPECIES: DUF2071 domain-containing protein [Myroides]MTG96960.1 DUF2071 domain-containing protein [Myroides albus]MVX35347.1 DUF2071 domain-containing protein [Myroides sp. LoEW2-1]UVD78288.1 DUF2071 domain-containing protein [Myroides albus]